MRISPRKQAWAARLEANKLGGKALTHLLSPYEERRLAWLQEEQARIGCLLAKKKEGLDILEGKFVKLGVRAALGLFHGTVSGRDRMRADLEASPRPYVREVHDVLKGVVREVRNDWQRNVVLELGEVLLWVADKDTAYQDLFEAFLARLQQRNVEVRDRPSCDWWPNVTAGAAF